MLKYISDEINLVLGPDCKGVKERRIQMKTGLAKDGFRKDLPIGSRHHRAFIGPTENYDLVSAMQFNLLSFLGLRENHFLLDIGCGSLRAGKLFIPYLLPGRYFGIEPEQWLVEEGIKNELGEDLIRIKQPVFSSDDSFTLGVFEHKFDFLLAQSIFSHTPQRQIEKCLSEAKKVMKPTSFFAATFFEGEENYTGDEWVYPDCVTFTLERMTSLAGEQGMICRRLEWPHPNLQTWLVIAYPDNEKNIPTLSDATKLSYLEAKMKSYQDRLSKIESHPYVRLGFKMNRLIRSLRSIGPA